MGCGLGSSNGPTTPREEGMTQKKRGKHRSRREKMNSTREGKNALGFFSHGQGSIKGRSRKGETLEEKETSKHPIANFDPQ